VQTESLILNSEANDFFSEHNYTQWESVSELNCLFAVFGRFRSATCGAHAQIERSVYTIMADLLIGSCIVFDRQGSW
jgi:hypothetical protein